VMDVVQLGDRIVTIHPGAPAPMAAVDVLAPAEPNVLRFEKGSGFGSIGEDLRYEFEGQSVVAIHGGGGMTMWPLVPPYDEPEPAGTTP
jgi:D-alanyl-D-alanine carboxypeptidase